MNYSRTKRGGRGVIMSGVVGVAMTAGMFGAAGAAQADTQPSHFSWIATSASVHGDITDINNGATNGHPGALLYVSPNIGPGGVCGCVFDNAPVAVYYDSNNQWSIFNEDGSPMPVGAEFNVFVEPAPTTNAFTLTATSGNSSGDSVYIDSTLTNGKTSAVIQATQVWSGAFNNHADGVWYNIPVWGVFNEGGAPMALGTKYNVLVGSAAGGKTATLKGTSSNTGGNSVHFSSSTTNGDSNTFMLDTPDYSPNGVCGCVTDTSQTGVWYQESANKEVVFNESNLNMQQKVDFNLLYWPS